MSIESLVKAGLAIQVDSGNGCWQQSCVDEELGVVFFKSSEKYSVCIQFCSLGMLYQKDDLLLRFKYEDILSTKSYLTTQIYSEAGVNNDLGCLVALDVSTQADVFQLSIPLELYSTVLITLNDCLGVFKS